ncbi:unnamed protein product, partial [Cylicostephanus goldi]
MTAVNSALNGNPFGAPGSINDPSKQAQFWQVYRMIRMLWFESFTSSFVSKSVHKPKSRWLNCVAFKNVENLSFLKNFSQFREQFFVSAAARQNDKFGLYHYLEALKTDENGWRKSTDNIVANNLSTDEEHFLLLQVVEDYLSRRYAQADADSVMCIRKLLSHWIQKLSTHPEQPVFLVNKMAHIFSLVFAADFPDRWPNFMDEIFLSRGLDNVPIVVFYLKTLLAIDSEVVDRDIQRTKT